MQKLLQDLQDPSKFRYALPFHIAAIYVALGEKDRAFAWLSKAYPARDSMLIWLKVDPRFRSLRSDPRFADLVRRIGLPP